MPLLLNFSLMLYYNANTTMNTAMGASSSDVNMYSIIFVLKSAILAAACVLVQSRNLSENFCDYNTLHQILTEKRRKNQKLKTTNRYAKSEKITGYLLADGAG